MKLGILILAICFAGHEARTKAQTFTSEGGVFRFEYPQGYLVKTEWNADEVGAGYIPVCVEGAICVVTKRDAYHGTNFQAASFQVIQTDDKTRNSCNSSFSSNPQERDLPRRQGTRTIGGVAFTHWTIGEAGLGNQKESDIYRAFHEGKCYELSVNIATSSFANSDPSRTKEFTNKDERIVRGDLMAILDSFRFVKMEQPNRWLTKHTFHNFYKTS